MVTHKKPYRFGDLLKAELARIDAEESSRSKGGYQQVMQLDPEHAAMLVQEYRATEETSVITGPRGLKNEYMI